MDVREIANMLESRGASQDCPACDEGELQLLPDQYALLVPAGDGQLIGRQNAILSVAAALCEQCGYVRLHATRPLE